MTSNPSGKVYVKTWLFEGWAKVLRIYPGEPFFPIEVELDEGDSDGHRIKRVAKDEIVERGEIGRDERGQIVYGFLWHNGKKRGTEGGYAGGSER